MNLDFTFTKYKEILEAISQSGYTVLGIRDFILEEEKPKKLIILRHDVDVNPFDQLKYAKLEHDFGISSTYYFRYTKDIFNKSIIGEIHSLGHEIGYHYEVLTKSRGDIKKSIQLFTEELCRYQENWNTVTVCPHGGAYLENIDGYSFRNLFCLFLNIIRKKEVFSRWNNQDIWEVCSLKDLGLIGDAYRSIDFNKIVYFSDTGRSWDINYKRIDRVSSSLTDHSAVKKSDDLIRLIESKRVDQLYLLVHFEQWKDNLKDWFFWYLSQILRRNGKKIIFHFRK